MIRCILTYTGRHDRQGLKQTIERLAANEAAEVYPHVWEIKTSLEPLTICKSLDRYFDGLFNIRLDFPR